MRAICIVEFFTKSSDVDHNGLTSRFVILFVPYCLEYLLNRMGNIRFLHENLKYVKFGRCKFKRYVVKHAFMALWMKGNIFES